MIQDWVIIKSENDIGVGVMPDTPFIREFLRDSILGEIQAETEKEALQKAKARYAAMEAVRNAKARERDVEIREKEKQDEEPAYDGARVCLKKDPGKRGYIVFVSQVSKGIVRVMWDDAEREDFHDVSELKLILEGNGSSQESDTTKEVGV